MTLNDKKDVLVIYLSRRKLDARSSRALNRINGIELKDVSPVDLNVIRAVKDSVPTF